MPQGATIGLVSNNEEEANGESNLFSKNKYIFEEKIRRSDKKVLN
jgi:hypothetical protein